MTVTGHCRPCRGGRDSASRYWFIEAEPATSPAAIIASRSARPPSWLIEAEPATFSGALQYRNPGV